VFDDAALALTRSRSIAGIDSLINTATTNVPEAQRGFRDFQGQTISLRKPRAGVLAVKSQNFGIDRPSECPLQSVTRCFNSQTRSAARSKALVRARVPAAGRSWEVTADFVAPLPFRERVFGFRPFDLVLRTRLAAGELTVKCPFPFMICFLSSFQAQGMVGRVGFANLLPQELCAWFQIS
jgi:hypothetical protein